MRSINPILLPVSVVMFLLVNRLYALALPGEYYFSFSAFLLDNRDLSKLPALAAKLSQPFIVAFLLVLLLQRIAALQSVALGRSGSLAVLVEEQASITIAFGAGMMSLLLAWPYILLWDLLIDPVLGPYRALYLVSYLAYIVGFGFFALSGAETARVLWTKGGSSTFSLAQLSRSEALRPLLNALSGVVATAISAFFAGQAG